MNYVVLKTEKDIKEWTSEMRQYRFGFNSYLGEIDLPVLIVYKATEDKIYYYEFSTESLERILEEMNGRSRLLRHFSRSRAM